VRRKDLLIKWYWFLEIEVLLAAAMGVGIALMLFVRSEVLRMIGDACAGAGIGIGNTYRERREPMGSGTIRPPRLFAIFFWILLAVELAAIFGGAIFDYQLGNWRNW
jgi:hypothetical protein